MSGLRTQASELKFRVKLLVGLFLLGALQGVILFAFWLADWRAMDLIQVGRVLAVLIDKFPTQTLAAAGVGGFLLCWAGALLIFKPWRSDDSLPPTHRGIKKPWEK